MGIEELGPPLVWVRPHPFPCCLKHSTGVNCTNKIDFYEELGPQVGVRAADPLDES